MSNLDIGVRSSTADVATDNRPLTDQEMQQVRRLLSDPFSFPLEFKTWLVAYLETSDLSLPISAIMGLSTLLGISGAGQGALGVLPAGIIFPYGGPSAPLGSLLCDGAGYSRASQSRLFAAIGTTYGAPDGTSFYVPDLRERVPVGRGFHVDHSSLGQNDGLAVGQRRVKHGHAEVKFSSQGVDPGTTVNVMLNAPGFDQGGHTHAPTDGQPAPTGGPAYITLNFIIVA